MKRRIALCLTVCMLLFTAPVSAAYWEDNAELKPHCTESNPACYVLQMVMMGGFDFFDPADPLTGRVLSAALPSLRSITEEDFAHFIGYFDVDEEMVYQYYYIALGNCLWAELRSAGRQATEEERLLLTLMEPAADEEAQAALAQLRAELSDEKQAAVAEAANVPLAFVNYLAGEENWRAEE